MCTALVVWYGSSILSIREGARKTLLRGEESTRRTRRRAAAQTHQRVYDDALARCVHFHHYASPYPTLSTTVPILHPPVPSKATQTRLPWSRHPPWSSKPANKTNQKKLYKNSRAPRTRARGSGCCGCGVNYTLAIRTRAKGIQIPCAKTVRMTALSPLSQVE